MIYLGMEGHLRKRNPLPNFCLHLQANVSLISQKRAAPVHRTKVKSQEMEDASFPHKKIRMLKIVANVLNVQKLNELNDTSNIQQITKEL